MPPSNILHAGTDPDLLTRLREMLDSSARADIAVGYFFISGFEIIADSLARLDRVRILVGRADRPTLEAVARELPQRHALRQQLETDDTVPRRQRAAVAGDSVAHIAADVALLPQTGPAQHSIALLRELVAAGRVEVRAYRRSPLHAKAYLCWYDNHAEPGAAVVGSSNLTLAGFSGNTELNVRVTGDAEMSALREWFDALWEDAEDIGQDLALELDRSWALAQTPPYHVYLKALYELYHSDLSGGDLVPSRTEELANFQLDAVRRGLAMIEAHGGCYVGDVVGLGKTFVGAELLRQLRLSYPQDGPPLVLCPAGLKPMWDSFNERFSLGAAVVSHSMIAGPPETEFDEELGRYVETGPAGHGIILEQQYANRGPVLVDEAHNFRNDNRRSRGLRRYLEAGDHKVVLLSATPQNLGPMDIYRQLTLFLDDTEHGLNLEPVSLGDYFRNVQRWVEYRTDYENYLAEHRAWQEASQKRQTGGTARPRRGGFAGAGTPPSPEPQPEPQPPVRPAGPRAEIEQALSPVFIRRRRKDIRDLYGDTALVGGQPVRFPEPRLDNVAYRLDRVYAKAGSYDELMERLRQHRAVRYRATDYINPAASARPEYRDLFRSRDRIAGLMAVLLLKRLESSIEAFRSTLNALLRSNRNFRAALDAGYVPIGRIASRLLSGQSFDADDLLEVLRQEEEARQSGGRRPGALHAAADFDLARWTEDLDADYECLNGILARVGDITPADDDKLSALRQFLDRPEVRSGKLLIFSEAETTIEYLYRELNPDGRKADIGRLTGSNRHEAENIVKRFAPTWNLPANESRPGPELRVLLATDIVSEGQNLQDCARVLNYDLHWNPVRLVQRFGRVDRIGTEHDVIHLHNMWPDTAVDADLSLTDRLRRRIQSFHDLIGLDSKLLSDAERLNSGAMYRIYEARQLPEIDDGLDEVAAHQRAVSLLQRIQEDDPDLWRIITELPDGIRSARAVPVASAATIPDVPAVLDTSDVPNDFYVQNTLAIEGGQPPLLTGPAATMAMAMASPFDAPRPGETIVLLEAGGISNCYAVGSDPAGGSDLVPRPISPGQFIAAAECRRDTPAEPLPAETNERVMAAFEVFRLDSQRRLGRARRRRDTQARRYVSRQLNIARNEPGRDAAEVRQLETLRRIFLSDLTPPVETALREIRELKLEGHALRTRLEALRERYRLNPPDDSEPPPPQAQVIRIVCSDGLV